MENISKILNFVGQFIQSLKKAGFTDQNFQEVIASKGNKLAENFVKLISGNYELVEKPKPRNLEFQGVLIIPKTQILKAEAFKHRDGSDNQQFHYENFKNILLANASSTLKSSEMKINEYKLLKAQNDYKNRDELGGERAIAVSSYDEVLIIMHHIMQNKKYRDGANIIYFMHNGVLHCAYCLWRGGEWDCNVDPVDAYDWLDGDRVFSFAELSI